MAGKFSPLLALALLAATVPPGLAGELGLSTTRQVGNWLVGESESGFRDPDAEIEPLDGGDPFGLGPARVGQIRYTMPLDDESGLALALETPASQSTRQTVDRVPDVIAAINADGEWGHWNLHAVGRELRLNGDAGANGAGFGWGVGLSFAAALGDADKLFGQAATGDGIGRHYIAGSLPTSTAWSATVGTQHWWDETLRSNLAAGMIRTEAGPRPTATVNLIWSPLPHIDAGLEYAFGGGGPANDEHRLLASLAFKF